MANSDLTQTTNADVRSPQLHPLTTTTTRHVLLFGAGPMPCDDHLPVIAPGARTWQIAFTAAAALGAAGRVTIIGLENTPRTGNDNTTRTFEFEGCTLTYTPMQYEELTTRQAANRWDDLWDKTVVAPDCVIGCASIQPCATAAAFARERALPLWEDIFGDPIAEVQSKAEISPTQTQENENRTMHVWRLMLHCLVQGDRFSGLSLCQKHALMGQLGCAGRLNRHTACREWIHNIPFGLFPQDFPKQSLPPLPADQLTVQWCGSFNTWMDEKTFAQGIITALHAAPQLRLMIVGGKIPGYNETSCAQVLAAFADSGIAAERIVMHDWQPLCETRRLYAQCAAGLSIDRQTVEAVLGSRTRLVNFLAAGLPVISTVITELTHTLRDAELLFPFETGNPADMARALIAAAAHPDLRHLGQRGREFVRQNYDAPTIGAPLAQWIANPQFAPDKPHTASPDSDNLLLKLWQQQ